MRFSLKAMLAASSFIAVSVAGLKYANLHWSTFFYTGSFLLVLTAIVGALVCPWPTRAFWVGFAVFGGGYFWLAFMEDGQLKLTVRGTAESRPRLATTRLLLWADQQLRPDPVIPAGVRRAVFVGPRSVDAYFVQVGNGIFTILLALVGGAAGKLFVRLRRRIGDNTTEP